MGLFRPITRLGRSVVFLSKKKSKSSKTREKQIESGKVLLFWIQIHIRLLLSYEQTDRERERGNNGVRERVVVRIRRDSRRGRGAPRGLPGEASLRPGSSRFNQVIPDHPRQA